MDGHGMLLDNRQNMSSMCHMATATKPKPFVKWAGGKQGIAGKLVELFPRSFNSFFEPFIGGGSVLLTLTPNRAVASDLNDWLLDTYQAIRDDWRGVARILDSLPNTKEDYLRIRKVQPEKLDRTRRAAHFIYLNKTCFRGLFRVNRKGTFNVPYGAYQRAYYDAGNLQAASRALAHVEFRHADFELAIHDVQQGDFVYFDPPYHKLGGYSDFNRYTRFQFRESDHLRLASLCRELDERGIRWAVSNSDTPFVREIYKKFSLIPIANRREINLNSQNRGIDELLIVNYRPPRQNLLPFDD
jgi:DNA adenine methylase